MGLYPRPGWRWGAFDAGVFVSVGGLVVLWGVDVREGVVGPLFLESYRLFSLLWGNISPFASSISSSRALSNSMHNFSFTPAG